MLLSIMHHPDAILCATVHCDTHPEPVHTHHQHHHHYDDDYDDKQQHHPHPEPVLKSLLS